MTTVTLSHSFYIVNACARGDQSRSLLLTRRLDPPFLWRLCTGNALSYRWESSRMRKQSTTGPSCSFDFSGDPAYNDPIPWSTPLTLALGPIGRGAREWDDCLLWHQYMANVEASLS
jgi:hypothetical protein